MTVERMESLWPIAQRLHEARIAAAWGKRFVGIKEPWPDFTTGYSHDPVSYVDLALAQADAITP